MLLALAAAPIPLQAATSVIATIPVGGGSTPSGIGANPITNKVYVAVSGAPEVSVIDGASNIIVTSVPLGGNFSLGNLAVNAATNKIYVAHNAVGTGNQVHVINGATDTELSGGGYPITVGLGPLWIAINPVANRVYVGNANANSVTVINGATDAPITTAAVAGSPAGIGVHTGTNRVYVALKTANSVEVRDGSFALLTTIPGMNDPNDVVVDSVANRAYVANAGSNSVSVIDTTTDTVVATYSVGGAPYGIALNPSRTRAYVANGSSSNVTVVNTLSGVTDQTVGIFLGPRDAEYNAGNGLVYAANFASSSVSVLADVGELCSGTSSGWWDSAWRRSRRIDINNGAQGGSYTDFPLLVKLDPTRIDYSKTLPGGADLRFVDQDNFTPLDYEIERWTPGGTSYVWVRVPQIPGTSVDTIYMYFDNPAAGAAQNPAGVWGGAAHNLVQHLEETAGPHLDSATADGANNDSVVVQVQPPQGSAVGQINGADLFLAASTDHIDIADSGVLNAGAGDSFTVEAWIKTTTTGAFQHIASKEGAGAGWDLMVWSSNEARFTVYDNGVPATATAQAVVVTDGNWHHVVGRWDRGSATAELFVDGFIQNTATQPLLAGSSFANAEPFVIGEEGDASRGFNFDGTIDEVRFSKQLRTNDWIRAQYLSMADGITPFILFGPEAGQCNFRSIGTRFNYGTGQAVGNGTTLFATQGSRTVMGELGTLWRTNNRGRGDAILIELVPYTIAAVNSETQLTLTSPYAGTTGGSKSYSIQRMFGTLAEWENCVDGLLVGGGACPFFVPASNDLVADNRSEVGIAYNDSVVPANADFTASVLIDGSVTDAVHTITLTADYGNTNRGLAGAGTLIDNSNSQPAIRIQDDYVTVSWLEIRGGLLTVDGVQVSNLGPSNHVRLLNLLIHDVPGNGIQIIDPDSIVDVYNTMIYSPDSRGILIATGPPSTASRVRLLNNTIHDATSSQGIESFEASNPNVLLRNNISITTSGPNFSVPGPSASSSDNLSGDGSAAAHSPAGGAEPGIALSTVDFVDEAPAPVDLHLKTTSYPKDKGANLSAFFPGDIDGGPRSGLWDIGADEFGVTTEVTLSSFTAVGRDRSVLVEWRTASELANLGFHLYRGSSENGPWTRLTLSLVPGLGSSAVGQAYSFRDSGLTNGTRYFYRLEDVDASSKASSHGPVSALPSASGGAGSEPSGGDKSDPKRRAASSCPAWVLAAYGSATGDDASAPSPRCTRHGDPEAVSLVELSRDARSATLELRTGGFYALHTRSGAGGPAVGVRVFVPGFDFPQDDKPAALPIRRVLTDAVVGRRVQLGGARALELQSFALQPSALGKSEMQVGRDGTVRALRRGAAGTAKRFPKAELVTLLPSLFQGEKKSAALELRPLRYDEQRRQLVLAKRVRVRLLFAGREAGESGRGSVGRAPGRWPARATGEVLARLFTSDRGLYAVAFEQLFPGRARGFAVSKLRLERQGEAAAFHVEPAGTAFGPGGRLFFHAERTTGSTEYSSELAWELVHAQGGALMPLLDASPGSVTVTSAPLVTRVFETNRFYQPGLLEAPDLWLWEAVASGVTRTKSFSLTGLDASGPAELEVHLQGASESGQSVDHHVSLSLNGTLVGEGQFAGKRPYRISLSVEAVLVREGTNELSLTNVADTGVSSLVFLDRFEVKHPQLSTLTGGAFEGTWSESGTASVGAPSGDVVVVDLGTGSGDSDTTRWLTGYERSGASVRFRAEAGRRYWVGLSSALFSPRVAAVQSSTLKSAGNQADYLLIAPKAFLDAGAPLVERRQDQGLTARAVAFEEIVLEFGHGQASPEAIQGFLAYAFHSWTRPSPRYVVLLGDASYDPRNFIGTSQPSPLPALWTKTSYLWTASDPLLAAVNGTDNLPDLAIGRLPATTLEQAESLVAKLLAWEDSGQGLGGAAALVADNPDLAGDFDADVDDIRASYLGAREAKLLKLSELGPSMRPSILGALNGGLSYLSYVGHGGAAVWASENVWNSWDAASLEAQSTQPLLITMNCLNGYFVAPAFESLSESLLKAEGRGAIASFSPSGLSLDGPAHQYHRALMAELTGGSHDRLGNAILAAQKTYAASGLMPELLGIYHLLGDPATKVR